MNYRYRAERAYSHSGLGRAWKNAHDLRTEMLVTPNRGERERLALIGEKPSKCCRFKRFSFMTVMEITAVRMRCSQICKLDREKTSESAPENPSEDRLLLTRRSIFLPPGTPLHSRSRPIQSINMADRLP